MAKNKYSWWDDPANKEEIDRISWWKKPENVIDINIPIALTGEDSNCWVAATTEETEKILGRLGCTAQGDTRAEAIDSLMEMIKSINDYNHELTLRYQRWVPFRKGDWGHIGGTWFVIFGIHVYFRCGKGMKGGHYIPFTKLNISIHSEWSIYKKYKLKYNS